MCDKLVFDLAQEVEGSPSVFVRKDWINILDNQTQNYTSNQSVLDTSQLSNSNKYMSYREAYFLVPMTLTMATLSGPVSSYNGAGFNAANLKTTLPDFTPNPAPNGSNVQANQTATFADSSIGLKNWFGNIIHSFTLDYNGSTIVQQTPFVNMWNSFKLMTSLSYNDVITQGCTIGFYPDDAEAFASYINPNVLVAPQLVNGLASTYVVEGNGVCNNTNNLFSQTNLVSNFQCFKSSTGNEGFVERCKWISFDVSGRTGSGSINAVGAEADLVTNNSFDGVGNLYGDLIQENQITNLWKSYISKKQNQITDVNNIQTTCGVLQYAVIATVYLKHVHSFFNMVPLLKGVFMKMTMNLNNCASTVIVGGNVRLPPTAPAPDPPTYTIAGNQVLNAVYSVCTDAQSALGGVNPVLFASIGQNQGARNLLPKAAYSGALCQLASTADNATQSTIIVQKPYRLSLSVGANCLDAQTRGLTNYNDGTNPCKSIYLYIPAYTFNPPFEQAYISSPVKEVKYSDIYQYQVLGVGGGIGGQFNNLLTNGIANVKSVLILPFYSQQNIDAAVSLNGVINAPPMSDNSGFIAGIPVWQSPFDPAGTGPTSPLCHFTNFNVQVSGQNAIYNLQLRAFEQFNNQLYGQNAVNGGLTDGITSSLVDRQQFDLEYCYYYVNVERMLPVEQSVPKSIQILGTNQSQKKLDLLCFIEYGTSVSIDVLTGARV